MSKFLQSRGAVADEVVSAVGVPVVDLNPEMRKEEIKDDNADDGGDNDDDGAGDNDGDDNGRKDSNGILATVWD